ncbi:hypothetical protein AVEN_186074-1 [Araneus ventricosus]|uniref:Uncharacterized protein n=1 Tax=Araneus ventricosus TaxID=182803 RepID=A0A4Y2M8Q4_ARAVE|nr:hypothetical protein AVEN_186074-1 [Araneus ventricosus]
MELHLNLLTIVRSVWCSIASSHGKGVHHVRKRTYRGRDSEVRPTTSTNAEIIARVSERILENRRVTLDETENELDISHGSVQSSIFNSRNIVLNRKAVTQQWLLEVERKIFTEDIEKPMPHLKKCLNKRGDHVEKQILYGTLVYIKHYFKISVMFVFSSSATNFLIDLRDK